MTDLARLVVALEAQTAKYQAGLDAAQKRLDRFDRDQSALLGGIQKKMANWAGGVQGILAGIGVGISFKGIIEATAQAEAAQAQLNNALKLTGANVDAASAEFQQWALTLQRTTTFNDEAIQGVEALLLRYQGLSGGVVKRATADVLDLAEAMNIDATSAAKLLGKALSDPESGLTALTRAGVVFTDAQKAQIKAMADTGHQAEAQAIILKELEGRFGGAAEAARNTFGGALEGLKNAFGDLLEGKSGMGAATEAINSLTDTLNSDEVKQGFEIIVAGFAKAIEFAAKAASSIAGFAKDVGEFFGQLAAGPGGLNTDQLEAKIADLERLRKQSIDARGDMDSAALIASEQLVASYDKQIAKLQQILKVRQDFGDITPNAQPAETAKPSKALDFKTGGIGEEGQKALSEKQQKDAVKAATEQYEGLQAVEQLVTDLHNQELAKRTEYDVAYYESVADLDKQLQEQLDETGKGALERASQINEQILKSEMDKNAKIAAMDEARIQSSLNLLGILFGKHKGVAAAIFLLQKRHAIAEAIISTKQAVMATYARLGYPFGIPAAIAVGALGAASIAEMIATNPGTASIITGGGGNGFTPPGSKDNPVHTTEQEGTRGVTDTPHTQIIFQGPVYGMDDFNEKVMDALEDGINVRDRVPIRTTSRQALELKG